MSWDSTVLENTITAIEADLDAEFETFDLWNLMLGSRDEDHFVGRV